jgi:hypothetical protein
MLKRMYTLNTDVTAFVEEVAIEGITAGEYMGSCVWYHCIDEGVAGQEGPCLVSQGLQTRSIAVALDMAKLRGDGEGGHMAEGKEPAQSSGGEHDV